MDGIINFDLASFEQNQPHSNRFRTPFKKSVLRRFEVISHNLSFQRENDENMIRTSLGSRLETRLITLDRFKDEMKIIMNVSMKFLLFFLSTKKY
jgi:hypothetical protein